jgi:hypothetical protein
MRPSAGNFKARKAASIGRRQSLRAFRIVGPPQA